MVQSGYYLSIIDIVKQLRLLFTNLFTPCFIYITDIFKERN